jgi:hypothetical protein
MALYLDCHCSEQLISMLEARCTKEQVPVQLEGKYQ